MCNEVDYSLLVKLCSWRTIMREIMPALLQPHNSARIPNDEDNKVVEAGSETSTPCSDREEDSYSAVGSHCR